MEDAGIAIRHSRGRKLFYTAGSRNGLEGVEVVCPPKLTLRKRHFFLMEKYIEDARQDEKHVPDLLESIMRPPGLAKEEIRPILFKMSQIWFQTPKNQAFNFFKLFGCRKSEVFPPEANASLLAGKF